MLNHLGFVGVWVWVFSFSSLDDFRSKSSEDGMLSMTSVNLSLGAANQLVVVGGGYL